MTKRWNFLNLTSDEKRHRSKKRRGGVQTTGTNLDTRERDMGTCAKAISGQDYYLYDRLHAVLRAKFKEKKPQFCNCAEEVTS